MLKSAQKSNWGKIYDIFSPSVLIFSPLGHAIIFLLSQTVYWGEKCRFPRGGINIHFRPKYRPLLSTPSPPPPCHPLLSPPRHLAKAGHRTTRRRRWRPAGLPPPSQWLFNWYLCVLSSEGSEEIKKSTRFCKVHYVLNSDIITNATVL